ncbi:PPA1309 family protein [Corynebacterium sphenisci]|uniref:PPA1309 family protein n=1 Tax=Corynebacterium sphenisci TaxID=191493 RepID=UPI0026E0876E|nr:PPA1309 family protein [Corynebacterium sphenisci]MDO5731192.1 PPA1309 family protein [Corynebacterium sphenisci]
MSDPQAAPWRSPQALNRATLEAVELAHAAGWDEPPQLIALVPAELVARALDATLDDSPLALVTQEPLPAGVEGGSPELADFLARTTWPAGVVGAVLVQEILVVDPADGEAIGGLSLEEVRARVPEGLARQARLISAVLAEGPELTLIQPRPTEAELAEAGPFAEDRVELRDGTGVADGVLAALRATFDGGGAD